MTDWKKVQGSQAEQPTEFDTASSAVVVYQRRNITQVTVENADGTTTKLWDYEEREMTREEYLIAAAESQQAQISQNRADIDYLSAMTETEL